MMTETLSFRVFSLLCALILTGLLSGCSPCSSEQRYFQNADIDSTEEEKVANEANDVSSAPVNEYEQLKNEVEGFLDAREKAIPIHAPIGEVVQATENLSVSVLAVEPGPYDYFDKNPTVRVKVRMDNLSDKVITVKASNWDADNTDGERVDHKLWIKDADGAISDRSFEVTHISPHASFIGVVYFDGSGLVDVVYEPHWLISSQNQCIFFDINMK